MTDPKLAIRVKPRPVRRLNPKTFGLLGGVSAAVLIASAALALRTPEPRGGEAPQELYNTTTKPMADGLAALPASYEEVEVRVAPPMLGPPLPGDLGAAFVGDGLATSVEPRPNAFRYQPTKASPGSAAAAAAPTIVDEARQSGLFFISPRDRGEQTAGQVFSGPLAEAAAYDQLAASLLQPAGLMGGVNGFQDPYTTDPNGQLTKRAFADASVDPDVLNSFGLQAPASLYQVMAGTIISASLLTGLNSDLPGEVIAQVTEPVYDTVTGRHLLIPQGARLLGRYDSQVAYGQSRALLVWTRLILPDGSSVTLDNLPAVDTQGYAGLSDEVDHHTGRLFGAAALATVLGIGADLGRDTDDADVIDAFRDGGQRTINQAGQKIVTRQLAVQPTITVRPGWRLRVIVNRDLVLRPYGA